MHRVEHTSCNTAHGPRPSRSAVMGLRCCNVARSKQKRSQIPLPRGPLQSFTVRRASPREWMIGRVVCAVLLAATIGFVILGAVNSAGFFMTAGIFAFFAVFVAGGSYRNASDRFVIDPRGIHHVRARQRWSIPWDQLEDVTIQRIKSLGPQGEDVDLMVFVTPTGKVPCDVPVNKRQLQSTILSYRDRVRAGNVQWEPSVGYDAISYPPPPDRSEWLEKRADPPAWWVKSLYLLGILLLVAVIVLVFKYRWES